QLLDERCEGTGARDIGEGARRNTGRRHERAAFSRLEQEHRHLLAGDGLRRAVVRPTTTRGDAAVRQLLDEGGERAGARDVSERAGRSARWRGEPRTLLRQQEECSHLLASDRIVRAELRGSRRAAGGDSRIEDRLDVCDREVGGGDVDEEEW